MLPAEWLVSCEPALDDVEEDVLEWLDEVVPEDAPRLPVPAEVPVLPMLLEAEDGVLEVDDGVLCVDVVLSIIESVDEPVVEAGFLVGSEAPVPWVLAMIISSQCK